MPTGIDVTRSPWLSKAVHSLSTFTDATNVAVVCIAGTYCPVTRGHIACLTEARNMLMDLPSSCPPDKIKCKRPTHLRIYPVVLGFIRVNGDSYTYAKMKGKGCPEAFMPANDRAHLIDAAAKDLGLDWLCACRDYEAAVEQLKKAYPGHKFTRYGIDGADVAVKGSRWQDVSASYRLMCAGRPSDKGENNGTDDVLQKMERVGKGVDSDWYQQGFYTILPELEDISSSAVRKALQKTPPDTSALEQMLHPSVLEFSLTKGPYKNPEFWAKYLAGKPGASTGGYSAPVPPAFDPAALSRGHFDVRRGCRPYNTLLRDNEGGLIGKEESNVRSEDADSVARAGVADGETACLVRISKDHLWGLVAAEAGEGWIQLQYLHVKAGETKAIYRRDDGKPDTCFRVHPVETSDFVKDVDKRSVHLTPNLEVVVMHGNPESRNKWDFLFAYAPSLQRCGWIKVDHLHFAPL